MMRSQRRGRWRWRRERGQTLVEFAVLAPALFLLFLGIVEMGLLFNAWVTVQDAAERGARYAITGRDTCSSSGGGRTGCIVSESMTAFAPYSSNERAKVQVGMRSWRYPTYTSIRPNDPGKACDAVEISVTYPYTPRIPFIGTWLGTTINLSGRQRFINEPFQACTAN